MGFDPAKIFGYLICFISALSVHEWAHAYVAKLHGDNTAESEGRLTLNPLAHIDPLGTVILPLVGALTGLPLIAWAKPVPVDPRNFKGNVKYANMSVAFAGPLVNIVMCAISAIILAAYQLFFSKYVPEGSFFAPLIGLLATFAIVNAVLAVFNLIPVPPLDGAAVLGGLLPKDWGQKYEEMVAPYGFIMLIVFLTTGALQWVGGLSYSLAIFFNETAERGLSLFLN